VGTALARSHRSFELICVDDGSRDGSAQAMADLAEGRPWFKPLYLIRNYGQSAALQAGFDAARGEYIVTLDGDLQNDPDDVPALLQLMDARPDVDMISGWRKDRQDRTLSRKIPSAIANGIISRVTGVRLHDYGCALKVYRAQVIGDHPVPPEIRARIDAAYGADRPPAARFATWIGRTLRGDLGWSLSRSRPVTRVLADALGHPEWCDDPRFADFEARLKHRDDLQQLIDVAFAEHATAVWLERLAGRVPVAPVRDVAAALDNAFVGERGDVAEYRRAEGPPVRMVTNPLRMSDARLPRQAAPALGEQTDAVLASLGYSQARIAALRACGAIG